MNERFDFLVFAPNSWHGLWRNRQHIFSRLAGPHRVLYVEPARISLRDWRIGRVSLADLRRPAVVEERPNLWLYRIPAWLPIRGTGDRFDHFSDRLLAWHLRRIMRQLGFGRQMANRESRIAIRASQHATRGAPTNQPTNQLTNQPTNQLTNPSLILWLYRPLKWRWAVSVLTGPSLTPYPLSPVPFLLVYHITDDYTAFAHLNERQRQALTAAERELLATADLTIVTAPRLLELKRPHARRIELVPNGVDYTAFQRALAEPRPPARLLSVAPHLAQPAGHHSPPAAHHPQHPILGYSGHISSRLDLPLLRELALARPGWQFIFAGSEDPRGCEAELAALKALPNVHLLGLLSVEDVPHFIVACDVCLIPYRVNEETRAISSLKLYEYLAAGKPVVSAAVPAAEEHAAVVRIAEASVESWLAAIESALAEAADPSRIAARQAVAARNTWDERVERIVALLEEGIELSASN